MDPQTTRFDAEATLRQAGLQKTAQRLAVLDILARAVHPLTAGDIFSSLHGIPRINRVTVYRILSSYTAAGIIREFESKKGIHHYERAWPLTPPHPHFNCRACGRIACMTALPAPDPWHRMADESDWVVENISISGLCGPCRRKEGAGGNESGQIQTAPRAVGIGKPGGSGASGHGSKKIRRRAGQYGTPRTDSCKG